MQDLADLAGRQIETAGDAQRAALEFRATAALADQLRGRDGIEQVVAFGNTLHVSGRDQARLEAAISAVKNPAHTWTRVRSGLEDVFISLMDQAKDNFA